MQVSAGLLMFVGAKTAFKVLLVHLGGPYWRGKHKGAWSIPKGLVETGEDLLAAAEREFREETGLRPRPPFLDLKPIRQKNGKRVHCWAFEGDEDLSDFKSGDFEMEWPPGSGKRARFPEVDEARFFSVSEALEHMVPAQAGFVEELAEKFALKSKAGAE